MLMATPVPVAPVLIAPVLIAPVLIAPMLSVMALGHSPAHRRPYQSLHLTSLHLSLRSSRKGSPPPRGYRGGNPPTASPRGSAYVTSDRVTRTLGGAIEGKSGRIELDGSDSGGERLYHAVRLGEVDHSRALIAAKADVDYRGPKFGNTCLMVAASRGFLQVARVLIAGGAAVDAVDKFGWSAMHHASKVGQLPIVHLLFASGADHSIVNKHGKTPLDLGASDVDVVMFFEMLAKSEDARKQLEAEGETKEALRQVAAAVLLQASVRGRQARSLAAAVAEARSHAAKELAATTVQAYAKGRAARRNMGHKGRLDRSDNAMRLLGDWHVASTDKTPLDLALGHKPKGSEYEEAEAKHPWAATRLQAMQRGNVARKKFRAEFHAEVRARQGAVEARRAARA